MEGEREEAEGMKEAAAVMREEAEGMREAAAAMREEVGGVWGEGVGRGEAAGGVGGGGARGCGGGGGGVGGRGGGGWGAAPAMRERVTVMREAVEDVREEASCAATVKGAGAMVREEVGVCAWREAVTSVLVREVGDAPVVVGLGRVEEASSKVGGG